MNARVKTSLWTRWILANAIGELIGLGITFAIGAGLFLGLTEKPGVLPVIASALLMTSSGLIEGVIVGFAQWWAMHPALPEILRRSWVRSTVLGALVAWFLGSIPMTIASLVMATDQQASQEPAANQMLLMEIGMGLAAGLVLGFPQWRVLRQHVEKGWWWMLANSIAWGVGIPIVFAAVDLAQKSQTTAGAVAIFALALLITGAVVGAIHGAVLVQLAKRRKSQTD